MFISEIIQILKRIEITVKYELDIFFILNQMIQNVFFVKCFFNSVLENYLLKKVMSTLVCFGNTAKQVHSNQIIFQGNIMRKIFLRGEKTKIPELHWHIH